MSLTRAERIQGGLWGLLIGDALGVPYEFHAPAAIPAVELIEFEPPPGFERAHTGTPPGSWSDDGAQALCLLASLLYHKRLDPEDLMRRLHNWYEYGYMAVDGRVFDVGVQTGRALANFRQGLPALSCGPAEPGDNGNGSLMRVLPLALWHQGTDAELVSDARQQSRVTHGHLRAQLCCALYCLWARRLLEAHPRPWEDAVAALRALCGEDTPEQAELEFYLRPDDDSPGRGTGYVVDSLRSARSVLAAGSSYESVVREAIRLGHDTDTTACIAGGLAGIQYGIGSIPARWRKNLREAELFLPLQAELIESLC